jgi:LysM repeat protein
MKKTAVLFLTLLFLSSCASVTTQKVLLVAVSKDEAQMRKEAADDSARALENVAKSEKNGVSADVSAYTVKAGDILSEIAVKEGGGYSAWKKIAVENNLKPPYMILPGEKLKITAEHKPVAPAENAAKHFVYRVIPNKAFGAGEKLIFAVKYFGITAGTATLEVKDIENLNGRKVYHIDATARTAPLFERFYRVKDVITSYMDVLGLFSWKYEKKLEEGGYRNDTSIIFEQEKGFAEKNGKQRCDIPPFVQDVLSEFYYYRSIYKGEDETKINVTSDECKTYQIVVKKLRKEKVTIDAGVFNCVVVQPFLKYEGIFRQKGNVWIWLTDDANLTPVMIKSQIAIGTIDVVLQSATVVSAE